MTYIETFEEFMQKRTVKEFANNNNQPPISDKNGWKSNKPPNKSPISNQLFRSNGYAASGQSNQNYKKRKRNESYYYTDFDFAWLCEKMSSDEISKLHNKYQKIKGTHGSSKSGDPSTQKVMNNLRDKIRSEKGSEGYKQWTSQERLKNRSKIDKDKLNKEGEDLLRNSGKVMAKSAKRKFIGGVAGSAVGSIAANNLMKRHHDKKLQTLKDSGASAEEIKKMQRKQLLKRVLVNIGGAAAGNVIGSNIGHLSSGVLKHNKRVKNFSKKVSDYNKKYQN